MAGSGFKLSKGMVSSGEVNAYELRFVVFWLHFPYWSPFSADSFPDRALCLLEMIPFSLSYFN
jgi:hypothetical protein